MMALHVRNSSGEGQKVDVSMLDSQIAILENAIARYEVTGKVPGPLGTRHPAIAPFQGFPTKDYYVIIPCGNDILWGKLCDALGMEQYKEDSRFKTNKDRVENVDELDRIISEITKTKNTDEWVELMDLIGHPVGVINNIEQVVNDPQVLARNMIVEVEHPIAGKMRVAGNPIKLSKTPGNIEKPAPLLGEHTGRILQELLGWNEEKTKEYLNNKQ
jgi:CoA:oxalate CoA-transferase